MDKNDFDRISIIFKSSDIDLKTIKEIDLYEVFPTLQSNLDSPVGTWAGFDEKWLFENCEVNYKKRTKSSHKLKCELRNIFSYWMRSDYWKNIEVRMNK